MEQPPSVVPYIDVHDGPRRVVTFDLDVNAAFAAGFTKARTAPVVSIDGRAFPVYWGRVSFEAPADRAVHVAVSMSEAGQFASDLLPPGGDLLLVYRASSSGMPQLHRA